MANLSNQIKAFLISKGKTNDEINNRQNTLILTNATAAIIK